MQRFVKGIWKIARKGCLQYELKQSNLGKSKLMSMTATLIPDATGDPRKVDWSRVCSTGMWSLAKNGEKHPNNISMRIAADSQYLYLNYLEQTPPGKSGSGNAFWRNCVEIFFAEYPCLPVWHIGISPDGVLQQFKHSLQNDAEQMEKCDLQGIFYNENKGNK